MQVPVQMCGFLKAKKRVVFRVASSTKTAQSEWIFWRKKICRSGIRKHCPIPDLAGRKGTLVWSGLVWQDKYTMMVVLRLLHIYYANSNTNIKKDRKEKKIKSKVWSLVA
jgi:hypothetical protein